LETKRKRFSSLFGLRRENFLILFSRLFHYPVILFPRFDYHISISLTKKKKVTCFADAKLNWSGLYFHFVPNLALWWRENGGQKASRRDSGFSILLLKDLTIE